MTPSEWLVFLVAAAPARRGDLEAMKHELAAILSRHHAAITAAYPDVPFDAARYLRRLAAAIEHRVDEPVPRVLETVPAPDLYLAAACLDHDATAVAAFRAELVPSLRQALGKLGIPAATIDETVQRVMVMVLVGPPPQLEGYFGRGRLRSWLRTIAVRIGSRLAGELHGNKHVADVSDFDAFPAAERGPELEVLRLRYGPAVRAAFAIAVASLSDHDRTLLREYHLEGLTIDDLAARYEINRATAARWVAAARLTIITATRAQLVATVGVSSNDADSMIRLVRSQLSIRLQR